MKKINGYKIIKPVYLGNMIVENKSQMSRLARALKIRKKELKFKIYSWHRVK